MSGLVEIIREKPGIEPAITDQEIQYIAESTNGIPDEKCEWWCRWPDGMEQSPEGVLLAVWSTKDKTDQDYKRRLANLTLPYPVVEFEKGREAVVRVKELEARLKEAEELLEES